MLHEILKAGYRITLQPEGPYIAMILTRPGVSYWDYAALPTDFTWEQLENKTRQFFPTGVVQ